MAPLNTSDCRSFLWLRDDHLFYPVASWSVDAMTPLRISVVTELSLASSLGFAIVQYFCSACWLVKQLATSGEIYSAPIRILCWIAVGGYASNQEQAAKRMNPDRNDVPFGAEQKGSSSSVENEDGK